MIQPSDVENSVENPQKLWKKSGFTVEFDMIWQKMGIKLINGSRIA